jgi:alkylation response protein AidB-like acyl-CoA dehydrogenase
VKGDWPTIAELKTCAAAFLETRHMEQAARMLDWCLEHLLQRPEPHDDASARSEARLLLSAIGRGGWLKAIADEDLRGLAIARENIAAMSPLADAVVALQGLGGIPLVIAGTDAQRARWLPGIVDGSTMTGFAMTESQAGSDVAALQTRATRDGASWVIDGEKHLISNAGLADVYIVFARTSPGPGSRGISAFVVPADAPGLSFAGAQVLAAPHPLGRVRFEACRVPGDALLGEVDRGFKLGMMALDRLRPTVGAAACGMAARAIDEAIRHASQRRQFGQPLSGFQLVREKLGRMATELRASRLLVYHAAWTKDRGAERITVEAAMAKSYATEAAQRVVDEAVQILGGAGVLIGHPVERLYRSVRALRIYEGATEIQRLIIAGALLPAESAS